MDWTGRSEAKCLSFKFGYQFEIEWRHNEPCSTNICLINNYVSETSILKRPWVEANISLNEMEQFGMDTLSCEAYCESFVSNNPNITSSEHACNEVDFLYDGHPLRP
jgi:hypothetical protein